MFLTRIPSIGFPTGLLFLLSFCLCFSSVVELTNMVDDVSQILEKMKLTLEEEETINISDEG